MMKQSTKTVFSLLLALLLMCQFVGVSSVARAADDAPANSAKLAVQLSASDTEAETEDDEIVYKTVTAADFDNESGLAVSFQGRPEDEDEDAAPSEGKDAEAQKKEAVETGAKIEDLRENGLFVNPPEGYSVSSLYIAADPKAELDDVVNLITLAEASATDASVYVPAKVFAEDYENEELDSPIFFGEGESYTVLVRFDALDEEDEIEVSYESGELELDASLVDAGDGSAVASVPAEWLSLAEEQGYVFSGWLLVYANGSSVPVESGEEIEPYADCTVIAQWSSHEPADANSPDDGTTPDDSNTSGDDTTPDDTNTSGDDKSNEEDTYTYQFTAGENSTWTQGSSDTLAFTVDGNHELFQELKLDDETLDKSNYTVEKGSTIITLSNSFLKTLSVGSHTITLVYSNGKTASASFTVEPAPVEPITIAYTLKSDTSTKTYDGKALALTVDDFDFTVDGKAADGFKFAGSVSYSPTDTVSVGTVKLTLTLSSVTDPAGKTLTSEEYSVTASTPTVTIKPLAITATAGTLTKVYDATALTIKSSDVTISGAALPEGYTYEASFNVSSRTEAGKDAVSITSLVIKDASGNDVSKNFNVTTAAGSLEVTKRPLTIETASATKVFDGTALTNKTTPTVTGRLEGHQISLKITGSQTKVGSSENTISDLKITDTNTKLDVTDNYEITYKYGTLTVTNADGSTNGSSGAGGTTNGSGTSPLTGDNANLGLWIGLMAAALVLIAVIIILILKGKKKDKDSNP